MVSLEFSIDVILLAPL